MVRRKGWPGSTSIRESLSEPLAQQARMLHAAALSSALCRFSGLATTAGRGLPPAIAASKLVGWLPLYQTTTGTASGMMRWATRSSVLCRDQLAAELSVQWNQMRRNTAQAVRACCHKRAHASATLRHHYVFSHRRRGRSHPEREENRGDEWCWHEHTELKV